MIKEPTLFSTLLAKENFEKDITTESDFEVLTQHIKEEPGNKRLDTSVEDLVDKSPVPEAKLEIKPKTVQETMAIIQPKAITYAAYDLSAVQEDMLTFITEQLQEFANNKPSCIRPDIFGQLQVTLDTQDFPTLGRNKKRMLAEIDKLRKADFEFTWNCHFANTPEARAMFAEQGIDPDSVEIETKGNIITTRHDIKSSSRVVLCINPWCTPFLLYIGKGVGGTKFYKEIAIGLPSKYSKRIYKMIMDWHTLGDTHEEPISNFRYCLQIPDSYDNNKIKKEILDRAMVEIQKSGSHITFDYELTARGVSSSKTKRAANTIVFRIHGNHVKKDRQLVDERTLKELLKEVADRGRESLCEPYSKRIIESGKAQKMFSKFMYYGEKLMAKEITKSEYRSTLQKIVLNETGCELRSPEHIKNAVRKRKREEMQGIREKGIKD